MGGVVIAGALVLAFVLVTGRSKAATADITGGRSIGRSDAPVKLDLWADFQCPTCAVFNTKIKPALIETYVKTGKASLTFHDMAFMGSESVAAAMGARCAERQRKFWPYHDLLFAKQEGKQSGAFELGRLKAYALTLGIDMEAFSNCLADPNVEEAVHADTRRAYAMRVKETPTLLVNGTTVPSMMNWPFVAAVIDVALKESSTSAAR